MVLIDVICIDGIGIMIFKIFVVGIAKGLELHKKKRKTIINQSTKKEII